MKKFFSYDGPVESRELAADYDAASQFDKLRVGKLGVYFKDGLKLRHIPFRQMDRAFIRVHEVNGSLCCGSTIFQYFRLVFVCGGKEYADIISEDEAAMDEALSLIRSMSPGTEIGFVQA